MQNMKKYCTITYDNGLPVSVEISDKKPEGTFDVTKAILEIAINLEQLSKT